MDEHGIGLDRDIVDRPRTAGQYDRLGHRAGASRLLPSMPAADRLGMLVLELDADEELGRVVCFRIGGNGEPLPGSMPISSVVNSPSGSCQRTWALSST